MQNFFTWTLVIFLIVLISVISFLTGIYIGKSKLSESKIAQEKQLYVEKISEKIKSLPGMSIMESLPDDIIHGRIISISGNKLQIAAEPMSINELLQENPVEYQLQITDKTKIYYLKIKDNIELPADPTTMPNLITEQALSFEDIKVNEQIAVIIDPAQKSNPVIDAIEIKVNR